MSKRKYNKKLSKKAKLKKIKHPERVDFHHLLYQRRHWNNGFAKLLRNHPYMGKMIPTETLHREIHSKIHDIPTPNGAECKAAYLELIRREKLGMISVKYDTLEERINFLIEMWEEKCPATVAILQWQKEVISKFYKRGN